MRKKIKWTIFLLAIIVFIFAPLPFPYFATFDHVYNYEGQEEDVTVKVRFFHFKPLFFHYGISINAYWVLGSVKIYDNTTGDKICTLKLDGDSVSKDLDVDEMHFVRCYYSNHSYPDILAHYIGYPDVYTDYSGYLLWDDPCKNIILHVHIDTRDFEKGNPWQTSTSTTYYSSKENLDVEEMKKTFITEDAVKKYIQ